MYLYGVGHKIHIFFASCAAHRISGRAYCSFGCEADLERENHSSKGKR